MDHASLGAEWSSANAVGRTSCTLSSATRSRKTSFLNLLTFGRMSTLKRRSTRRCNGATQMASFEVIHGRRRGELGALSFGRGLQRTSPHRTSKAGLRTPTRLE